MRDVAVVSFAQVPSKRAETLYHDAEIAMFAVKACVERIGLARKDVDFVCSGSTDFISGVPFSFVSGLDAVGAWPPMAESHVEADAAWALYEAWVKIQTGEYDTALVYGFGTPSTPDSLDEVLATQLDPYTLTPLWPHQSALAALQARALLETTDYAE
ncbi:MAG: lipid-transfer protein, partial [Candidatus Methylomirabilis sp.]|nr:lipid-transfer protein [Deltaproteobacteria bacterium]